MNPSEKLRFAVMLPGFNVKAWQVQCLATLLESGAAEAVLVIMDEQAVSPQPMGEKLKKYLGRTGLYHAYERYFLRVPALQLGSVEELLTGVELVRCHAIRKGKYSDYMPGDVLQRLHELKPDFILRFAFNILKGDVLSIPRLGVWSFHHADEQVFRGGPAAFWEIYHGHAQVGVILQRLTEKIDAGPVLQKGYFKTSLHSYAETLNRILSEAASWPAQLSLAALKSDPQPLAEQAAGEVPMNRLPGNGQFLLFLLKLLRNRVRFYWERYLQVEEWNIGLAEQSLADVIENGFRAEPRWLMECSRKRFAADPALHTDRKGRNWVIYENYIHTLQRGEIHALCLDDGRPKVLLQAEGHLAFPRVLRTEDGVWLSVESAFGGSFKAWKLVDDEDLTIGEERQIFPGNPIVDGSVVQDRGRFFLFGTLKARDTNTTLHLWSADSLWGPWTEHPASPLKYNISSARMAGPLFYMGDQLLRPAQDSAKHYGHRISIQWVEKMDEANYREEPYAVIEAGSGWKYNEGMHSIDGNHHITLIDAKRYVFSLRPLMLRISQLFRS